LVINIKTQEQRKISVPGVSELEKEYGNISSVRHDPPNFRYLCFRHFGSSGQYETIFECTTGLLAPKAEFKVLGALKMDPKKMRIFIPACISVPTAMATLMRSGTGKNVVYSIYVL
jgi:hypothetical protein